MIKNDMNQTSADLENVLIHLDLVFSEENLMKNLNLLQNCNRDICERGD